MIVLAMVLALLAFGGIAFAFAGGDERSQKRVTAIARPQAGGRASKGTSEGTAQKRKNVAALLKDIEKNQIAARKKDKPTMRRRLEQAGFPNATVRGFWILSGIIGLIVAAICFLAGQSLIVSGMAVLALSLGLPRWVLNFRANRRK